MDLWKKILSSSALVLALCDVMQPLARAADPSVADDPRGALKRKDFAGLEKTAAEFRATKAKTESGLWRLDGYYDSIAPDPNHTDEGYWKSRLSYHEEWRAKYPTSITAHITHAEALVDYAWAARWGYVATPEPWQRSAERLAQARTLLEAAEQLPEKDPHWFAVMLEIALGEGWDRAAYDALYHRAVAAEPTYYTYYFRKANFLLPRWFGEEGEWEKFAGEAAAQDDPAEGLTAYTRIAWANARLHENLFKETAIEWEKMKQGFRDIEKAYPNSTRNLSAFCRFAFDAEDRETTLELLVRIGNQPVREVWPPGAFEKARRWAGGTGLPAGTQELAILRLPEHPGHSSGLSFSPDGKSLAVTYQNGKAIIWDLATRQPSWLIEEWDSPVSSAAFSPDGKLLAVASGLGGGVGVGTVAVYDPAAKTELAEIGGWMGLVSRVAFTPDGRTLVMVGGKYQEKSEGQLWDVATGKVEPLGWPKVHHHHLEALAISPDSRLLAVECGQAINVWDLVKRDFTFFTQQSAIKENVISTAFSPDGKLLAAGCTPGWEVRNRSKPGGVLLWDTAGWKERKPGIATKTGGISSVAFSPDSRLLAGGGYEQCVRLWDVASGTEIATFYGHEKIIRSVVFSPDGFTIASSSADGTVRLWKVPR